MGGAVPGGVIEDRNLYVARDGDEMVGFISFGRGRDARKAGCGEIYAIYLRRRVWGRGIGFRLFERAVRKLKEGGIASCYLWVLDSNVRAIASYERWGGRVEEDMILRGRIGSQEIEEIMMSFSPVDS
ncbi:MAG: GNAT family N-acetyltransferase [Luteolibacter sp.]